MSDYGGRLKVQLKEINEKSPKIYTTGFVDEYTQNLQKYDECKISQNLTVEEVGYLEYVYYVCKDSTYFKEGDVKRIVADYEEIYQLRKQLLEPGKLKSSIGYDLQLAQQKADFNRKLQKILNTADKDPVLKKLKQNAPDFMMAKLGGDDGCPLVLFFDIMHNKASAFHSDLAFPKNYKFVRKNADVLKVFIGDFEFTFVKNQKNSVNATFIQMIDPEGDAIISKNTAENNFTLQMLCNL